MPVNASSGNPWTREYMDPRTARYLFGRHVLYHNSIFEKDHVMNAQAKFVSHC